MLTDLQGTISDGPGDYPENTLCEWLIKGKLCISLLVRTCG